MPSRLEEKIRRAYQIIGSATPLPVDCGELCNHACCTGSDEMGMLLFPGEAQMLRDVPGFRVHRIRYMGARALLLTCDGNCDREMRPLNCRVFPLAPHIDRYGAVTAVPDPRGLPMCPLWEGEFLDIGFRNAVEKAFQMLAGEPRMLELMRRISREVEELWLFTGRR